MSGAVLRAPLALWLANVALERSGWTVSNAEIDVSRGTARVEVKGFNGRLVTLDVRSSGAATLTREVMEAEPVTVGRRGDRARVERLRIVFLGRDRFDSPGRAVQALVDYLSENSPAALSRADATAALAPMTALVSSEVSR